MSSRGCVKKVEEVSACECFHREDGCFALQRLKFLPKISQTGKKRMP